MTSINSAIVASSKLRNPEVFNEVVAAANIEQIFVFPSGTKQFTLLNRSNRIIKYAWDVATSGTTYISLTPYATAQISGISQNSLTIYFQSSASGGVLEIETWLG